MPNCGLVGNGVSVGCTLESREGGYRKVNTRFFLVGSGFP